MDSNLVSVFELIVPYHHYITSLIDNKPSTVHVKLLIEITVIMKGQKCQPIGPQSL